MFLKRLNEITKPKIHTVSVDLGFGDGVEELYFRELSFEERQNIFGARANDDGTLDVRTKGLYLGAELVSASLCHKDGKAVVTVEAARKWDSKVLDRVANEAMKALNAKPDEDEADPSKGQS